MKRLYSQVSTTSGATAMAEEREIQTPLLQNSPSSSTSEIQRHIEDEILPFSPSEVPESEPHDVITSSSSVARKNQRLVSLDVFRGLTIALMILVDDAGGAFPSINHSPWFGVTIADFVMPFFLFIVGFSVGLVFKKTDSKSTATKKVIIRVIKLFLLGIFLQGGFFHGRKKLTYGVDVKKIRWLGVLQRISIGYLLASVSEIWLANGLVVDSHLAFVRRYYIQWMVPVLLCITYICLLYGLNVPSWEFDLNGANSTLLPSDVQTVQCGVRGNLDPPCNSAGFIDRLLLGESHLYQRPVYRRVMECSVNSPDYGPLPPNSPGWCLAPFDPEGILSSLMAAVTCFVGLHFGQIIAHFKDHFQRMFLWSVSASLLLISGYVLQALGMPLSKPLYTVSYMCITAGASGLIFVIIFYLADVKRIRKPVILLQWMGMNALLIYALAACEIFPVVLQGFYWGSPENNLVDGTESFLQEVLSSKNWGTFAFVLLEIIFWGLVAGLLHMKRIYVKL
ncbi:hypothetical protein SOVF_074470 isoform A [Spinacia oleracea]|uniref:Uncharacterized protein isoform X1 n=1 Tax=Spinacia oleracea TaxID=3562 RepID=A0A9R0ITX2_SPIOL|nr:uncharacterized protein LOC110794420 isoform X1 [Spinacia oleracea]KNA18020.1 hypothetical protein SOVF_074470 isoform A [Spinacia oleracea]